MKTFEKYLKQINEGHGMGSFSGGYENVDIDELDKLLEVITSEIPAMIKNVEDTIHTALNHGGPSIIYEINNIPENDIPKGSEERIALEIIKYCVANR